MPTTLPPDAPLVLLVDDDEMLREVGGRMLHKLGYRCRTATDGLEALAILARDPGIAIVVSDVRMPGMDGVALVRAIRGRGYPVQVVVASGSSSESDEAASLGELGVPFISKPFLLEEFAGALGEAVVRWGRRG